MKNFEEIILEKKKRRKQAMLASEKKPKNNEVAQVIKVMRAQNKNQNNPSLDYKLLLFFCSISSIGLFFISFIYIFIFLMIVLTIYFFVLNPMKNISHKKEKQQEIILEKSLQEKANDIYFHLLSYKFLNDEEIKNLYENIIFAINYHQAYIIDVEKKFDFEKNIQYFYEYLSNSMTVNDSELNCLNKDLIEKYMIYFHKYAQFLKDEIKKVQENKMQVEKILLDKKISKLD